MRRDSLPRAQDPARAPSHNGEAGRVWPHSAREVARFGLEPSPGPVQ